MNGLPISSIPDSELAFRLLLALVFGMLVGIERRWHHKNAGIQTHALVCVGSTTFGLLSRLGFGPTDNPMLIAAGVVTGIGFIGGGVIMHRGATVQGINTAATLWATAAMGLAAGAGYYALTYLVLAFVLTIQFPLRWAEHVLVRRFSAGDAALAYRLYVSALESPADPQDAVIAALTRDGSITVRSVRRQRAGDRVRLQMEFTSVELSPSVMAALSRRIGEVAGVTRTQIAAVAAADERPLA